MIPAGRSAARPWREATALAAAALLCGPLPAGSGSPQPTPPPGASEVTVVAGSGASDDGIDAREAVFAGVAGLQVDSRGNLFFSESGANRIRHIDLASKVITSAAGTGRLSEPDADDGTQLRAPGALALDEAGRGLYVAEVVTRRIKRVHLETNAVEDLGGPPGGWGKPAGLLWTARGLLVADAGHGQIFRHDADGTWSPLLPRAALLRRGLRALAADADGRLYAAEYFGHRVVSIDLSTGRVETVAGTEHPGMSADGDAGGRSMLRSPDGLAVDREGRLLIADSGNRRICRLDLRSGRLSTVHRSEPADERDHWTPGTLAVDRDGVLWSGDSERARVLRFPREQARPEVFGNGSIGDGGAAVHARLAHPSSVAVDRAGNIFISDTLHHRVRVVDARDGVIATIAGTGGVGYNGDGIPATEASLSYPAQIALDPQGRLYIGDYYNNRVRVVERQGTIFTLAGTGEAGEDGDGGPAIAASLTNPHALFMDGPHALIVTSAVTSTMRRIDLRSGTIERIDTAGMPEHRVIHGVGRWNGDLLLVMPRPMPGTIERLRAGGRSVLFETPDVSFPYHVAVSPCGELYICDTGGNRVLRWNGQRLAVAVAGLGRPRAIAFDHRGDLLVAETFHNRVVRVRLAPCECAAGEGQRLGCGG